MAVYVQDGMLPESFNLMGEDYTVKEWMTVAPEDGELAGFLGNTFYIVVRDDVVLERIYQAQLAANGESYYASSMDWEFSVNLSGTEVQKAALADRFQARFETNQLTLNDGSSYPIEWVSTVRQDNISDAYSLYGSFTPSWASPLVCCSWWPLCSLSTTSRSSRATTTAPGSRSCARWA